MSELTNEQRATLVKLSNRCITMMCVLLGVYVSTLFWHESPFNIVICLLIILATYFVAQLVKYIQKEMIIK